MGLYRCAGTDDPYLTRMLVIGGGIIGLEMGTVLPALGSEIDVGYEMPTRLYRLPTKTWSRSTPNASAKKFNMMLETKVTAVEAREDGLYVSYEGEHARPSRFATTTCWSPWSCAERRC